MDERRDPLRIEHHADYWEVLDDYRPGEERSFATKREAEAERARIAAIYLERRQQMSEGSDSISA